jgi:hypothetical protein
MVMVGINEKGYEAFKAGIPEKDNPYFGGRPNNLQRERAKAWRDGWKLAKRESAE